MPDDDWALGQNMIDVRNEERRSVCLGHILRVPTRVLSRCDEGVMWCFVCRKRVTFTRTVHTPTDPLSYYGPHVTIECEHGHTNGDLFPGYVCRDPEADWIAMLADDPDLHMVTADPGAYDRAHPCDCEGTCVCDGEEA